MTKKRRNNGRSLMNRGMTKTVHCANCARLCPRDKAISRFLKRSIIENAAHKDIKDASAYAKNVYEIPKTYLKVYYCIACAIHGRIVRVRSHEKRREREPPKPLKRKQQ